MKIDTQLYIFICVCVWTVLVVKMERERERVCVVFFVRVSGNIELEKSNFSEKRSVINGCFKTASSNILNFARIWGYVRGFSKVFWIIISKCLPFS